jgi:ferric-dicitrate binding protein FerR (iron transport regulator)
VTRFELPGSPSGKPSYESLSRLLAGELPEDEARRLRELVDDDPEVRAAWAGLQAAVEDVGSLRDAPVPPHLDDRVLGIAPLRSRARRAILPWVSAGLLAAAAAVALLVRPDVPTVTVLGGTQVIEGRADVLAAGVPIAVDGTARVTVDPHAVSVSVTKGTAKLTGSKGNPLTLAAGESHTVGDASVLDEGGPGEPGDPTARIAALEAQVEALSQALAEAEFAGAVTRGQLTASQGEPAPWPDGLPEAYQPAAFERNLEATLPRLPGAEVHALDCSEYPCIATLKITHPAEGWEKQVEAYVDDLSASHYPKSDTWIAIAKADADGAVAGGVGLAITPEYQLTEDLRTRTQYRVTSLLGELQHPDPTPSYD